jgi:endonuclease V-like protein UPF0215 family
MRPTASADNNRSAKSIGIDDGPFPPKIPNRPSHAPLVAVCLKGPRLYRVQTGWITVDGLDATDRAQALLEKLPKAPILLSGVTFGGFNLIDPWRVQRRFRTPTVVVVGSRPDNNAVKRALVKHFPDWQERWKVIRSLGPLRSVHTMPDEPPVFYEAIGCSALEARRILANNVWVSRVPEPVRVAGLVARGLFSETSRVSS